MVSAAPRPMILIAGGGYVGMYTALRLQRLLRRSEAQIVIVDPRSYMTYQPFLPEAAAGSLEPRHVIVPLRRVLPRADVVNGRVIGIEHASKTARVLTKAGTTVELSYDVLVLALGSIVRTLPVPGLAEQGIGFKQVEEAISVRNHVLDKLDLAHSTSDPAERRRALTFVVVGGGYAGIEALGELEDMTRYATRFFGDIAPSDVRWVLVEATGRILPEVGEDMGRWTVDQLRERGIDVRLNTRLESCVDGHVVLSDGTTFDAETLIWTAGVKASPVLTDTDLPLDERGRVRCTAEMRVVDVEDAWAAGDCAAVPDLTGPPGTTTSPNAQHAVRQARLLGSNIAASLRGRPAKPYEHKYVGSVASLGLYKGVAQVYGIKVRGWPAWFMHRSYHLARVPTLNRKVRVVADWTLALFFRREIVSLGRLQDPRREFVRAAGGDPPNPSGG
jgi:NADH dehydrogenase